MIGGAHGRGVVREDVGRCAANDGLGDVGGRGPDVDRIGARASRERVRARAQVDGVHTAGCGAKDVVVAGEDLNVVVARAAVNGGAEGGLLRSPNGIIAGGAAEIDQVFAGAGVDGVRAGRGVAVVGIVAGEELNVSPPKVDPLTVSCEVALFAPLAEVGHVADVAGRVGVSAAVDGVVGGVEPHRLVAGAGQDQTPSGHGEVVGDARRPWCRSSRPGRPVCHIDLNARSLVARDDEVEAVVDQVHHRI